MKNCGITIKNFDESFLPIFEAMAKSIQAEYKLLSTKTKTQKKQVLTENGYTPEFEAKMLKEAKDIKENPHLYKSYKNVDKMFKDILND
ncbi:hypothetical protein [Campylobacter helveticus]|uniref:Toxin-antitoxin system, antitoxin component n=1 Tax=Campylobacter helveticus TaxID=28898 RepID=A0AAX2UIJ0_9BACT|nr:hypothetical protein [Campylobacter helveticus]ARE79786.1 hypothetical protein CHELV3228_0113 [Campylobacter helveticus]MCR2039115.1 hypothetical protein [Campylobacter helveticus]MCR2055526.1 hypothetical protein [Campylobacter helveticus]MCR2059581.1 hypothetical protein [Campylobacter helveticus]MCR2061998.1 hypothetical protein [Campylobacter helveticus]